MRAFRHIGLLVNLFLSCAMAHAQMGLPVYDRLVQQREAFPLERVYVHTDAEDYLQGDRIWLKAYLMDEVAHTPVDSTLYLYVELFDKDGKQARRESTLDRGMERLRLPATWTRNTSRRARCPMRKPFRLVHEERTFEVSQ